MKLKRAKKVKVTAPKKVRPAIRFKTEEDYE